MRSQITIPFFARTEDIETEIKRKYGENWEVVGIEQGQVVIDLKIPGRN